MSYTFRIAVIWLIAVLAEPLHAQTISSIIQESPHQEAFWSVTVRDENGKILESLNPYKSIIPASNQKLVTTAAILDHFGSDYTFETNIYGEGELIGNTWNGNLIIKGSGDPSISGDLYDQDRYHVFKEFLRQLKRKGIQRIEGNLIADVSLFDDQLYPKGWDWYDMSFYYGVQISPLSFNNNAVDLEVFANGEIGKVPRIQWFPDSTDYIKFINHQKITLPDTEYDEYYRRKMGSNQIELASTLPQGYYEEESLSVNDPPMFFIDSFKDFLIDNGVAFDGFLVLPGEEIQTDSLGVLAVHRSKTLAELIEWTNKESDNFYTEMMLKTLAADVVGTPGTFEEGIDQVRIFLADQGIDTTFVQMSDGSGMAYGNFNQTAILSQLLVNMQTHSESKAYFESLSVAGISGTLAYRMKGTPLYENFTGKSGYVSAVRTLTGTFKARSGKKLFVSMAANHFIAEKVRPIDAVHEQILIYLYDKY